MNKREGERQRERGGRGVEYRQRQGADTSRNCSSCRFFEWINPSFRGLDIAPKPVNEPQRQAERGTARQRGREKRGSKTAALT